MNRFLGTLLGTFSCGVLVCLIYVPLFHKSLTATDGLEPGFAWMYLILLTGIGVVVGGVIGYRLGPWLNLANRWQMLKEQLQPPGERRDES